MPTSAANQREHAHELVDRLPADKLDAVSSLLEKLLDPVSRALASAPIEDESISETEEQAVAEARAGEGETIPHEVVLAELGLTLEDFERMARTPLPAEPNAAD